MNLITHVLSEKQKYFSDFFYSTSSKSKQTTRKRGKNEVISNILIYMQMQFDSISRSFHKFKRT